MANWFENNQTKSVIVYTLLVIAGTWGFYRFTFEETKLDLYKAQVESKQTEISQYQARIDFLEKENIKLEALVKEFEDWNSKSTNPTLFYKTKLDEVVSIKHDYEKTIALNIISDSLIKKDTLKANINASKVKLPIDVKISKGKTYINDAAKLVVSLTDVYSSGACNFIISAGNTKNDQLTYIQPGRSLFYTIDGRKIEILVVGADYVSSSVQIRIRDEQ